MATRRWYITRVVGTGTDDDPYRSAAVDLLTGEHVAVIPTDPVTGAPVRQFALVRAGADDFTALDASPDCTLMFDDRLDTITVGQLPAARVQRIATLANSMGASLTPGQGVLAADQPVRRLVLAIGRALDRNFN